MGCLVLQISVLIPSAQMPSINAVDDMPREDKCLNFDLSLHLYSYFVSAQD